jgi:TPR repeat protein
MSQIEHVTNQKMDVPTILEAALMGDVDAQVMLSQAYETGEGVVKNKTLAILWAKKASKEGSSWADFRLARMYMDRTWQGSDPREAIRLFKRSSIEIPTARMALGAMYMYGMGVRRNYKKAFKHFSVAATSGSGLSYFHMAQLVDWGKVGDRNIKKVINYFERASDLGETAAMVELGKIYQNGIDAEKNPMLARYYLRKAVWQGDDAGKVVLAYIYYKEGMGIDEEMRAFELATQLAQKKIYAGQRLLSVFYEEGFGTLPDPKKSELWRLESERNPRKSLQTHLGG